MSVLFNLFLYLILMTDFLSAEHLSLIPPRVINSPEKVEFISGASVQEAIERIPGPFRVLTKNEFSEDVIDQFSDFARYQNQIPFAVAGNFNNDGVLDVAVMGLGKDRRGRPQVQVYLVYSDLAANKYKTLFLQHFVVSRRVTDRWSESLKLENWNVYVRKGVPADQRHYLGGISKDLVIAEVLYGPSFVFGLKNNSFRKLNP